MTPSVERWLTEQLEDRNWILDAGTGSGHWLRLIGDDRSRTDMVGLDVSPIFLDIAADRCPDARFVLGDMTSSPFPDDAFDAVVCAGVLDTLPNVDAALREFSRVLRPGGLVALVLRGGNQVVSAGLETGFRWLAGAFRAFRERAWESARVPRELWVRDPLLPRLPALSRSAGLEVVELTNGTVVSRVLLRRSND